MSTIPQAPYELDLELLPWNSNCCFSEQTEKRIRTLTSRAQLEVHQLECDIAFARAHLDSLLAQHIQKITRLKFLQGATSALKRVPPEILGKIFFLSGDGKPAVLPPNYSTGPRYPWTLGQVSSYWRQVLHDTPDVWRTLEVGKIKSESDTTIEVALEIFSRVQTRLSLFTREEIDLNNPIGTFILQHANRFQHISIRPTHDFLFAFLGLPGRSLRSLESIEIICDNYWRSRIQKPLGSTTALHTAQKLTKVALKTAENLWDRCPMELILLLPWGQLSEISFTVALTWDKVHAILSQCSRLITCTLTIHGPQYGVTLPRYEQVILPALRQLTLISSGNIVHLWEEIFRPLETPSLIKLHVVVADRLDVNTLISFLTRSQCPLKGFGWGMQSSREFNSEDLNSLLRQMPSLDLLFLPQHRLVPDIFRTLMRNTNGLESCSLPVIRYLMCGVDPQGLLAFTDLMEYCVSEGGHRMEEVHVRCWEGPEFDEAFEMFTALKPKWEESGRKVEITCLEYPEINYDYDYQVYMNSDNSEDI